jgi:hypothetical protein
MNKGGKVMRIMRSKKSLIIVATMVAAAVGAAVAIAAVTSQTVLADGNTIHYRFVRTAADGLDSGWHTHPGLAIVQVQEGALQITQGSCTPKTVAAGETLIEVPYLPVRGTATGRVVWTTSFVVRAEDPLSIPVTPSPCP